jgi:hypothetical protein
MGRLGATRSHRPVRPRAGGMVRRSGYETTLLNQGVHTSWATVRQILANHQVATIVLPTDGGKFLRIRKGMTPEPEHLELYRLLGVSSEIMQPIKIWG